MDNFIKYLISFFFGSIITSLLSVMICSVVISNKTEVTKIQATSAIETNAQKTSFEITRLRTQMLNDNINYERKITELNAKVLAEQNKFDTFETCTKETFDKQIAKINELTNSRDELIKTNEFLLNELDAKSKEVDKLNKIINSIETKRREANKQAQILRSSANPDNANTAQSIRRFKRKLIRDDERLIK